MSAGPAAARGPEGAMAGYKEFLKRAVHAALDPVVAGLARAGVRADYLTFGGFVLSIAAGFAFAMGHFSTGATFALLAGMCDILDGQVARRSGHPSRFGSFFDSTLDRVAEAAILIGIGWFYMANLVAMVDDPLRVLVNRTNQLEPVTWAMISLLATLALAGSFMVSYTRARAEGLGLECKVGWFERPERLVLLIVAGYAGIGFVMPWALMLLAVLSFATAIQRMVHVWKITRGAGADEGEV